MLMNPIGVCSHGSQNLNFVKKRTVSIDLASVATVVAAEQDVTVSGLEADEVVVSFYPAEALGVAAATCYARVKQADTLTVCVVNPTAGALNAAAKNFTLITAKIS